MNASKQKIGAIIAALSGTKYSTDQKQNFAKAITDDLTSSIDFAKNIPKLHAWLDTLAESSFVVAENLTEFLFQYSNHSDSTWIKAAICTIDKEDDFISRAKAMRNEFVKLALSLSKKKKPGPDGNLGYMSAMCIAKHYLKYLGEAPSSGKSKKLNSNNSANIYMSAYDRVCEAVGKQWAIPISDTAREKARVEIRNRVK